MQYPKITQKIFYAFICILAISVVSNHCFAGEPLSKKAQENANLFFKSIIKQDYEKAYECTSGTLRYTTNFGGGRISGKEEFIAISEALFNEPFRDALKAADNFTVECCLSSKFIWGTGDITVWFGYNGEGIPESITNPYMIVPSFDCSKAQTAVEKTICKSLFLSNQDQRLKNIYAEAQIFLTGQKYKKLKQDQIAFIKDRNNCGDNETCIDQKTIRRIMRLGSLVSVEMRLTSTTVLEANFDCTKAQTTVGKTICKNISLIRQDQDRVDLYEKISALASMKRATFEQSQINFLNDRKQCGNDESCIQRKTAQRIKRLQTLFEKIVQNTNVNGIWTSYDYKSSGYCGPASMLTDDEMADSRTVQIKINYPYAIIKIKRKRTWQQSTQKSYKITNILSSTFARVYYQTVYSNNYFGSCGGDIFNLPYSGRYLLFKLSNDNALDEDSPVIVLTGHEGEPATLVYGNGLLDDLLLDEGYILKKEK